MRPLPPKSVLDKLDRLGLDIHGDGKVEWRNDAPEHPKNWPVRRKLMNTGIITLFVTASGLVGNVGSSVASEATEDLRVSLVAGNIMFASVFFYGQAIGGLFLPPYTESFGRKNTNIVAAACYCIANIIIGVPQKVPAIIIGRFISGFLSALPTVVGSGSIEDLWEVRPRIWAIDIWIKGSIIGIALGPSFATYIGLSSLHWPWVFHLSAIIMTGICACFFLTHETRPSVLLGRHLRVLQKCNDCGDLWIENKDEVPNFRVFTHTMLLRPTKWFFTEPIVCAVTIMSAVVFSSAYLLTEGLTVTYTEFGFSERSASLVFLAWIVGLVLTIPLRVNDWRILSQRLQKKQKIQPEDKLIGFFVAAPTLAVALWWFSWTVPRVGKSLSPYISLAGVVLVGAAINEFDGILQGYLTDSYAAYAASANAPLAFGRGLLSGSFPIFGRQMFSDLGPNVAGSVLAGIATLFCFIAFWFRKRGAVTRQRSKYAVTVEKHEDGAGFS